MVEPEQRVYVVMGNDYPETVFAKREDAEAFCEARKTEENAKKKVGYARIHWRYYDFKVNTSILR